MRCAPAVLCAFTVAFYFHAPTREDWGRNADRACSDSEISLREAAWYRARLTRYFRHVGFGLHVRGAAFLTAGNCALPIP